MLALRSPAERRRALLALAALAVIPTTRLCAQAPSVDSVRSLRSTGGMVVSEHPLASQTARNPDARAAGH